MLKWSEPELLKKGQLSNIPKKPGVYRVVIEEKDSGTNGLNIIYIGHSSKGQQGLNLEINNLLNPQRGHYYTLKPLLEKNIELLYQYCLTTSEDSENIEYHLIDHYEKNNLKLPPRNRSKPKHLSQCNHCVNDTELQNLFD